MLPGSGQESSLGVISHAAEKHAAAACNSECLDGGLVLEQNGYPVPNRVDPLTLVALQSFLAA